MSKVSTKYIIRYNPSSLSDGLCYEHEVSLNIMRTMLSRIEGDTIFKDTVCDAYKLVKRTSDDGREVLNQRITYLFRYGEIIGFKPVIHCPKCGNGHYEIYLGEYCRKCSRDMFRCDDCGEIHDRSEVSQLVGTRRICGYCVERHYFTCSFCGNVKHNDDMHEADGRKLCGPCYRVLFRSCRHCHVTDRIANMRRHYSDYFCQDCYYSLFTLCEECHNPVRNTDVSIMPNGERLCRNCSDERQANSIRSYSYKPPAKFYGSDKAKIFIGIEIECEYFGQSDKRILASDITCGELYVKSDSSLNNGMEIVSHPMSLQYHKEFGWASLCNKLKTAGFKSHDTTTCGLHLHASKCSMTELEQIKLGMFVNIQKTRMEILGRRASLDYAKFKDCGKKKDANKNGESRYEALNWQNEHTVEFRFPKGTLKYETLMATIELVHACVIFVKTHSVMSCCETEKSWDKFTRFVSTYAEYNELVTYMKLKNLIREVV